MKCSFNKDNIIKTFYENKNSHAFLVNTNNIKRALDDVKYIIKNINCETKKENCTCKFCSSFNNDSNPDIVIVKPEGKEIKKDSIEQVIKLFSTTPLISKYSVYIIINADLMNISSSNKILKFLEEPEDNIIGFFITDKVYDIIDTIKSRCQIFDVEYPIDNFFDYFNITDDDFNNFFDTSMQLLNMLNTDKRYILVNYTKNISKLERVELIKMFGIIYNMYILKFENLLGKNIKFNYSDRIIDTIIINDLPTLLGRIKLLGALINRLKSNVNRDLAINSMFMEWV